MKKKYCVALFDDENLDSAVGRSGMNINLASKLTDYKIDAYGVKQYERIQEDQKTPISEIEGVDKKVVSVLNSMKIEIVSDLLEADMENLLNTGKITEDSLDGVYESVQKFVEREIEVEPEILSEDSLDNQRTLNLSDEEE